MKIIVTGGAGFIGSALVRFLIEHTEHEVINIDKLTYASNLEALKSIHNNERYHFERVDICDAKSLGRIFKSYQPDAIVHLAAESHVDRSINSPSVFIQTNIIGTYTLLDVARSYWLSLEGGKQDLFRFHHVSTDEVYGDLDDPQQLFTEVSSYSPSSPYSASKASSDHLVRAWNKTYALPVVITNCSNNYGPYQFPEKLIPLTILRALSGQPLTIYGSGLQVRDWLYVEDHVHALYQVLLHGKTGSSYNIGGHNEKRNIEVVTAICDLLDELAPNKNPGVSSYKNLITYIKDRPGHDQRYAIDATKIKQELGWTPFEDFESGLRKTVKWYLTNQDWIGKIQRTDNKENMQHITNVEVA